MGRIKKAAGPKHEATLSPALAEFVSTATQLPLAKLPAHLRSFPFRWPYPRGDLYHWIPLLDLFDDILERVTYIYGLDKGPQTLSFGWNLLERGLPEKNSSNAWSYGTSAGLLPGLGFSQEGDRELVESILVFSRLLLENCGNRSLYASSDRLGFLLNSTSLTLVGTTLHLASRLAIRYLHSRLRGPGTTNQYINNALLASHYNIDLEKVQKLADPFVKAGAGVLSSSGSTTAFSVSKGKEKMTESSPGSQRSVFVGSDMFAAAKNNTFESGVGAGTGNDAPAGNVSFEEWGDVCFHYYKSSDPPSSENAPSSPTMQLDSTAATPSTPTPARRTSAPSRPSRLSTSEVPSSPSAGSSAARPEPPASTGLKTVAISRGEISSTCTEEILQKWLPEIPKEFHYDLLVRVRTAKALVGSPVTRRQALSVRILALTNLAYVYPEPLFQQKILQQDSDEPRRLQIVQQLADLVHPPNNGLAGIPLELKTIALGALESLSKHKSRAPDVCAALSVNVSHGVLLYILRKTAADLATEGPDENDPVVDEWQEALLSLLDALPSAASRTAESLVGAGLLEILVDVLKLRTAKAERIHHKVLTFLSTLVNGVRDAFQAFVNCKGLDVISDLIAWEVASSIDRVGRGQGLQERFKSQVTDYQMPYFQQQTLRWLFKFVNHMMTHGNTNFDRLLRNLIDSPPLLKGLHDVLRNSKIFGSTIWSGAVNILSSFIHNEPTSYAVIAEAGLSQALLDSICSRYPRSLKPIESEADAVRMTYISKTDYVDRVRRTVIKADMPHYHIEDEEEIDISRPKPPVLAHGILPATDAINAIPPAFGAICLNTGGLDLFLSSKALESFFEVFESREHVKSMAAETNLPKTLGQHFDELVRHHPRLKSAVMRAVVLMLARVTYLCKSRAFERGFGAKLWVAQSDGHPTVSGGLESLAGSTKPLQFRNNFQLDEEEILGLRGKPNVTEETSPSVSAYVGVVSKFLSGFFDNQSLCGAFIHEGGLEFLLDLATLPSLPHDFNNHHDSHDLSHILHLLVESKPHLVLPSLLTRTLETLQILEPLMSHDGKDPYFAAFTRDPLNKTPEREPEVDGTATIKALVSVHTLCNILQETFLHPPYGSRSNHTLFSQTNLTDLYVVLVKSLGRLYRVCVWEEIQLQNVISGDLRWKTRINGYGMGSQEADEVFGFIPANEESNEVNSSSGVAIGDPPVSESVSYGSNDGNNAAQSTEQSNTPASHPTENAHRKNVQALRFLLSQIPSSITPFLQGLGRALVPKRRVDSYLRQNAYMVADALAEAALDHLKYERASSSTSDKDRYAYWIVAVTSLSQLLIEGPMERPHAQCLTLVLQAFKNRGGLSFTNELLETFFKPLAEKHSEEEATSATDRGIQSCLYGGMKLLLVFYAQITSHKYVVESTQSHTLNTPESQRDSAYYFNPAQFLVELRVSILEAVRPIWDSNLVDKFPSSIIKCLVDILGTVLKADSEINAHPASTVAGPRPKPEYKTFALNGEKVTFLKARDIPLDLVQEALYRCNNGRETSEEYCEVHMKKLAIPRIPVPAYDIEKKRNAPPPPHVRRQGSEDTIPDAESGLSHSEPTEEGSINSATSSPAARAAEDRSRPANVQPSPSAEPITTEADVGAGMAMSIDNLLNLDEPPVTRAPVEETAVAETPAPIPFTIVESESEKQVTIGTLDDLRGEVRKNLIDRVLDVLSAHDDLTFELSDLILIAAAKAPNASALKRDIGATLVQSLISFQLEDDFTPTGKKVACYANLLALVIQDKDFYEATLDELKDNFSQLFGFIKIAPNQAPEGASSPWIGQVLLIVEKLLSEDVQPQQIKWTPPASDSPSVETSTAEIEEPIVSLEDKLSLFHAIASILPHISRDRSLALSVVRVLVILTRERQIANQLAEKQNLQKLFVMVKQLSGISDEKFQSSFMLVLRHIMEDDETIKRVMRSEIRACFQSRPSRPIDTSLYVRTTQALVLRAPKLFLEVTNEMLKLQSFDPNARPQALVLKEEHKTANASPAKQAAPVESAPSGNSLADQTGDATLPDVAHPSTEEPHVEAVSEKAKSVEAKFPVLEHPDGVVHFLLSQLLNYKDVEDKDPDVASKTPSKETANAAASSSTDMDVDTEPITRMPPPTQVAHTPADIEKKSDKPEYKPENHPIYVYRCFLLQCLSELLMSYSRAKLEFINYSRKTDSKGTAATPSKPRSQILNYLLQSLIPCPTLERNDSIALRKTFGTSGWAISVVVSICLKTNENGPVDKREMADEEPDPDLLFIRKFVLEQALKAFKDAQISTESLDTKYARLLSFADLFGRLLNGRILPTTPPYAAEPSGFTIKEVAKIMFEKNYIAALTGAIADIDLNFPNAKRAVKYILRPLKVLTQTAITLSETSDIFTTPGQTDEDEISTATSVSDVDDGREETPDLFRHSTLGILDPGREEESSSESADEDEEMYDDEYDEGIEYEEEMNRDNDELVSDEDDELDDAEDVEGLPGDVGMDVEVVLDDDDDEDEDDDEDDEDDDEDDDDMDEDDDDVEVIEEITGDDGDSLGDGQELPWEDEDGVGEHLFGQNQVGPPLYVHHDHTAFHHGHEHDDHEHEGGEEEELGHDTQAAPIRTTDDALDGEVAEERYIDELEIELAHDHDEEEIVDEEDDEDIDDEDILYPDGMDSYPFLSRRLTINADRDIHVLPPRPLPWGWDLDARDDLVQIPHSRHHHHHQHVRRITSPWSMFTPPYPGSERVPSYRHHRAAGARAPDDGLNPLLQRRGMSNPPARNRLGLIGDPTGSSLGDWVHMIHPRHRDGTVSLINGMMSAVGVDVPPGAWPPGSLHLHFGGNSGFIPIPRDIQRMITSRGLSGTHRDRLDAASRSPRDDGSMATLFYPTSTPDRWLEEARLLYGQSDHEKTQRIVNSLLKILVPPALEEERARKKKEAEHAEALRKQKEEEAKAKEERLAKEKAEKEAAEQKEREEREAAEQAAAEERAERGEGETEEADAMEGVVSTANETGTNDAETIEPASEAAAPTAEPERVRATFRGREYDITHLGIDLEYLDALPEELREEVLMQQLAEQRSQAVVSGEAPTDINREFLEALPPDIREEILQQEAQDRRRRERSEARRQAAASGGPASARAEDMDTASFLASLDPHLRNAVLMEQDDAMIAQLPASIAAEARALTDRRGASRWEVMPAAGSHRPRIDRLGQEGQNDQTNRKPAKKPIVQMLDKPGVATLLRLLFVSQQGSSRTSLNQILENASKNRHNRDEILNILLSILQEGSVDGNALERSFVQLSLRAKQRDASQKTPQPLKRTLTGPTTTPLNSEMTPLMVIQQCLSALVHLTETNHSGVAGFFLSEHDSPANVRNKTNKKGKGKDTKESRYPINALLSLLDRKMIMESANCMEQLSSLMCSITQFLNMMRFRAQFHKQDKEKKDATDTSGQPAQDTPPQPGDQALGAAEIGESADAQASAPEAECATAPAESTQPTTSAEDEKSPEITKKAPEMAEPVIPEGNLRLIVKILAARECSSKTFRDTLSTINNLSAIGGAKEIFGRELVKQAQDLGEVITRDLDFLLSQIQGADTSHEVHGIALSKFSPSSSDQAKLLRVLTALDYLFDPERLDNGPEREDIVSTLYESSTFGPLWAKLSDCLRSMRQRDDMLNTATILLPLVEALMVVCKNTTLKEASMKASKEFSVTSPVPESSMDGLFFRFTEEHRKILNELVRNNPRLMSGTFSLLVKNPKVLEFDNKRNYFTRRLHSRSEVRHPQAPLQLSIRREQTFLDSYRSLYFKSPEEMKYGKLSIRFHGEEGVDAGGVTREWFQTMSRQMFNPDYYLFVPVASDRTTFHPNRLSHINEEHLFYFKFIGRIIGKALYEGRALDCHFSRAVYKRILGKSVSLKDMETLDLDYYKSLLWMLENDISDIITETFSIESQVFDVTEVIDLVENGRNIPVTEENKHEYVQLVVEYRLTGSVQAQLEEFLKGFHDIVDAELISIFNEQELELLISGLPDIDVDDWKNNTEYHNYSASSAQIQWFWRAVRSFDKEERAKLLQFVTGTAKVPLNGFRELEGMNGFSRFNIHRDYGNKNRLPSSHTCFNQLDLPEYEDYETLRQRVYTAMTAGSEYFGFA